MTSFNATHNLDTSQRVILALKEAREKLERVEQDQQEKIAIVGMSGRFPGAETVEQFWQNLCNGVNAIQFLSQENIETTGISPDLLNHPLYVNAHSSLADIDGFDAAFFGYSPREAEILDPQHRVFLECAWSALENAGYDPQRYEGEIAIYAGAALNSYLINLHTNAHLRQSVDRVQAVISNVMGLMPTRVSYKLNLRGASCGIQTGCSTSLVAVHLACQSLLNQECDMALAGGVAIDASGQTGYLYQEDGVMSPDGYCRAFDAEAKGTVFGNGVGIVVLKRLSAAIADKDYIYAVIKGSAINNDGSQKVGLTAPSVTGQAAVIAAALAKAEVEPDTIQYVEAHGTGTALGDPIEIAALTKVFRSHTSRKQFCAIGSVKTNIGHLDAAAGITGLIKTSLALKHKQIPPSLNFQSANPQIDFANSPFFVNTHLSNWQSQASPRRAAISSFGMGGTNAHVILEEFPVSSSKLSSTWELLILSAKTPTALSTSITNLSQHLKQHSDLAIADVAYTLQIGRQAFDYRAMVVVQNSVTAAQSLSELKVHSLQPIAGGIAAIAFLFPGQGSQYPQMGRELYETEPTFRAEIDRCCEFLQPILQLDLRDRLYNSAADALMQTAIAQPAVFTLEYALAKLWISWGIRPEAMIGHSIGEYVAACLAGVLTLEDALKLVAIRGKLMQSCTAGAMLSIALPAEQVKTLLKNDLTLAAVNAPKLCVVSGSHGAIETLEQQLTLENIGNRRLRTSHAFHSPQMEPIVADFISQVQQVKLSPPKISFISNVTGTWITSAQATDPTYWGRQLRQTVNFASGLDTLLQKPNLILLEVGAGRTLSTFAKQTIASTPVFYSLRHPQEQISDRAILLNTLGNLWLAGVEVDWKGFYTSEKRQRVPLPTYPFEHQRYWVDLHPSSANLPQPTPELHKHSDIAQWFYVPSWKRLPLASIPDERSPQSWLLFTELQGIGQALAQRLQQLNQTVVTVSRGDRFSQNNQHYTINPTNLEDYALLLRSLQEKGTTPNQIVHFWSFLEPQFSSLVTLTQALQNSAPTRITVITNGLQEVSGSEISYSLNATVLGACKVIPQEYPHLKVSSVDLFVPDSEKLSFDRCVKQLLQELAYPIPDYVAYRGQHRWIQTFEPIQLSSANPVLRQAGTYLIAGDLVEGLGLIFAQQLAENFHARLILIGRAGLPERSDWDKWLITHGQQDSVSQCLRTLQNIEATSELHFFSADLGDTKRIQAIATQVFEKVGTLHGMIHADTMGDRASCLIAELNQTEIDRQFRSKVQGLLNLEQALHGKVTDFYLLQSSLSTVVGGVGFAAYAAANCFLDSFAQSRRESVPWISVNWDACRFDQPVEEATTGQALIDLAMTPAEVWEVTQRLLSHPDLTQVVVSPVPLSTRIQQSIAPPLAKTYDRPQVSADYVSPRNAIEQTVATTMQELLGIEAIGIYDNFFELGGHSLLAIQAVSRLRETFNVELPMRDFLFGSPTVAGIAKIIAENQTMNQSAQQNQQDIEDLLNQIEGMDQVNKSMNIAVNTSVNIQGEEN